VLWPSLRRSSAGYVSRCSGDHIRWPDASIAGMTRLRSTSAVTTTRFLPSACQPDVGDRSGSDRVPSISRSQRCFTRRDQMQLRSRNRPPPGSDGSPSNACEPTWLTSSQVGQRCCFRAHGNHEASQFGCSTGGHPCGCNGRGCRNWPGRPFPSRRCISFHVGRCNPSRSAWLHQSPEVAVVHAPLDFLFLPSPSRCPISLMECDFVRTIVNVSGPWTGRSSGTPRRVTCA